MPRTKSIITVSDTASTVAGALFPKHPLYRPGTKFILDFTDEFGGNTLPTGAIASGASVQDLTETPKVGAFNTGVFSNLADHGGIVSPGGSAGQLITLGSAGDFQIPVDHEMVFILWAKQAAAAAANAPVCYLGPAGSATGNACQFFVSTGAGGNTLGMQIGTGAGVRNQSFSADVAAGAPTQLALRYRPSDGFIQRSLNGAPNGTATLGALNLQGAAAMVFQIASRFVGTIYACQLLDITEAMATEAAWGFSASEILDAPAHVLRDYQFMRGALSDAPRSALA